MEFDADRKMTNDCWFNCTSPAQGGNEMNSFEFPEARVEPARAAEHYYIHVQYGKK